MTAQDQSIHTSQTPMEYKVSYPTLYLAVEDTSSYREPCRVQLPTNV